MTPEEFSALLDLIDDTSFTVGEALSLLGIEPEESVLEIEDQLMIHGIEPCDRCGRWVSSEEIQEDSDDSVCLECYEDS